MTATRKRKPCELPVWRRAHARAIAQCHPVGATVGAVLKGDLRNVWRGVAAAPEHVRGVWGGQALRGGVIIEAGEACARYGRRGAVRLERSELPPEQHLSIRLQGRAEDCGIGIRIKGRVECAVTVHSGNAISCGGRGRAVRLKRSEASAEQHLPVRLQRDGIHCAAGVWIESAIEDSGRVDPRDAIAGGSCNCSKGASEQDLPIRLHHDTADTTARGAHIRIEACIESAVGIDPRDAIAGGSCNCSKGASEQDLPIWLDRYAPDTASRRAHVRIESIGSAIGIEPRDAVTRLPADAGESAADHNLPVWLHRHACGDATRTGIKARVQRPVRIDSRHAQARGRRGRVIGL